MNETIKIQSENVIQNSTLNNSISKLYSYIENITPILHTGTYATSAVSGSIEYANNINTTTTSANLKAVAPITLYNTIDNTPSVLNTYFNNNVSNTVTYSTTSMQYVLLLNKAILMFGKINTTSTTATIDLQQLFNLTPYSLYGLYFIQIGGGEMHNNTYPIPIVTYMSNTSVIISKINYDITDWFALGKIY